MTKKTVKDWVLNEVKDGSINLEEVVKHGCVNGCVSSLIYYTDTTHLLYNRSSFNAPTEFLQLCSSQCVVSE
jgi:hypothetical protein